MDVNCIFHCRVAGCCGLGVVIGSIASPRGGWFQGGKLIVDTGIAYARLGEAPRAEPLITEGLRRETAGSQRGRALHAYWLATPQFQQGKLDAACLSAALALDLTSAIDSPRVAEHLQEFRRCLTPYARETPVIRFEERMREALR